jgi:hypothetical protein
LGIEKVVKRNVEGPTEQGDAEGRTTKREGRQEARTERVERIG